MEYIAPILLLVFMEGVLSLDNAMVLAVLAKTLPESQQRRALTYGIIGAFAFRFLSLFLLSYLMQAMWLKLLGGGYLLWMAYSHFASKTQEENRVNAKPRSFWATVFVIEMTDIAFSIDSILAAVAVSPNFYVVLTGGILGIIMMRVAANGFIKLLDRFPRLEHTAYLLVAVIGAKLVLEYFGINLHHGIGAAGFWIVMLSIIAHGFMKTKSKDQAPDPCTDEHSPEFADGSRYRPELDPSGDAINPVKAKFKTRVKQEQPYVASFADGSTADAYEKRRRQKAREESYSPSFRSYEEHQALIRSQIMNDWSDHSPSPTPSSHGHSSHSYGGSDSHHSHSNDSGGSSYDGGSSDCGSSSSDSGGSCGGSD